MISQFEVKDTENKNKKKTKNEIKHSGRNKKIKHAPKKDYKRRKKE